MQCIDNSQMTVSVVMMFGINLQVIKQFDNMVNYLGLQLQSCCKAGMDDTKWLTENQF